MAWQLLNLTEPHACEALDAFCQDQGQPSAFHSCRWARAIGRVYGARCLSLWHQPLEHAAAGQVTGVFPVFAVRSVFQRPRLVSVPYGSYGGWLGAGPDLSDLLPPVTPQALGRRPVLVRRVVPAPAVAADLTESDRVTLWLRLPAAGAEALWKSFPAKVRNQVRKAEKEGVTTESGTSESLLAAFHQLYARRMHELGTPAHGLAFFRALSAEFAGPAEVILARHQGEPVAAVFDISWGRWRINLYGAALFAKRSLCANNLVYWRSLEAACNAAKSGYDFGRSRFSSGQYDFKRQWGAEPRLIVESLFQPDPQAADSWVQAPAPAGPSRKLAAVWQRLPAPAAALLAACLRRYVW